MYTEPTPADLKARYPAFAGVADETLQYWLTDARRFVDQTWSDGDYGPALIAVACHEMIGRRIVTTADSEIAGMLAMGVTDFQSGGREGFRVSFSDDAIKQALSSEYEATVPGQEYLRLLRRNKGGPGVTAPGHVPFCGYPYGYPYGAC